MRASHAYSLDDVIVAKATTTGGLRSIVRLSGQNLWPVIAACVDGHPCPDWSQPGAAFTGSIRIGTPEFGAIDALAYVWPTSASYTRQPSVELHCCGSPPIIDSVVAAVCRAGARIAAPGEFTLRAFLAGRLDLVQAESILALVDARTRPQLDAAIHQLAGGMSAALVEIRERVLGLLAELEAGLDFVDEDIEFISSDGALSLARICRAQAHRVLQQLDQRAAAQTPRVALYGPPNVGKSSLLNALCQGQAALVSPQAGTTRDYVEHLVQWGGLSLKLVDTAGLSEHPTSNIDCLAQAAARQQTQAASLRLRCVDAAAPKAEALGAELLDTPDVVSVWTKLDLRHAPIPAGAVATSSLTGEGLDELRALIVERLNADVCSVALADSAARCRESLERADACLEAAIEVLELRAGDELAASELRGALEALGEVVGAVHTDDLLSQIFSRFCIGK